MSAKPSNKPTHSSNSGNSKPSSGHAGHQKVALQKNTTPAISKPGSAGKAQKLQNEISNVVEEGSSREPEFYSMAHMERDLKKGITEENTSVALKPTKISPKLVAERCLSDIPSDEEELYVVFEEFREIGKFRGISHVHTSRYNQLFMIKKLKLDRCNIMKIENLDLYTHLTHVYLQCIKKIGDELMENKRLQFLDLANNEIEECDISKLPKSIAIFNVENNPLKLEENFVKSCLPNLMQFNKREYIDEEFVPEEKLPFDRTTLSQMRSSQSGLDLLKNSKNEDQTTDIPTTSASLAELAKANSDIVENYKHALMEEMDRIRTEFKDKKEKLIAEIQERKSKLRAEKSSLNSTSSDESSDESSIDE
ncbi:hypothetical protein C9374_008688 [Naegleria lovaniensis]|uniref:Uncharacterized protein n=1 Tax=Naegleria lovaniensis TaxID=51637 RepID=A0AA88GKE1_NAELO|nr:uncharacterized protein C9374_008688 [Naegleria lovaniensis]KAG2378066.1 hypothetical protein C9374_008688 [Naegleria lovaniensis]